VVELKDNQFIKGFLKGFKSFGHLITVLINSILLTFVYIIGVGISAVLSKIVSKHFLMTRLRKDKKSYWTNLNLKKEATGNYYRQF